MKHKRFSVVSLILFIFLLILLIFFFYKPKSVGESGAIRYPSEICKEVEFNITEIECGKEEMKIYLSNIGSIDLNDSFLVIVSTEKMQAFIGSSLGILESNQTSALTIDMKKIEGIINRIEIVFQPCPFSTKIMKNLNIRC